MDEVPLRERKQQRVRDAIIEAALDLFAEQGFDRVTVADIARRAEVGRTTFFRYFRDKQEVLFPRDAELLDLLVSGCDAAAAELDPLGTSLTHALLVVRAGALALARHLGERPDRLTQRARLIEQHPELSARSLVKERGYAAAAVEVLVRHGAVPGTAELAASLAVACFAAGQARTVAGGPALPDAVDEAFRRLAELDAAAFRDRLG